MVNKNYQKGARYERKLVNEARTKGHIALRSAGSHSRADVVIIDSKNLKIWIYQCKKGKHNLTKKMVEKFKSLSDTYVAVFDVMEEPADRRKKVKIINQKGGKN